MRTGHAHPDMALTELQLAAIRRSIKRTAADFCYRLSLECVEDLTQEVLLRLWKKGIEQRLLDCFPYLCRVAENATIDMLRSRSAKKRRPLSSVKFDPAIPQPRPSHTPEELLIAREEAARVMKANPRLRRRVTSTMRRHFRDGREGP